MGGVVERRAESGTVGVGTISSSQSFLKQGTWMDQIQRAQPGEAVQQATEAGTLNETRQLDVALARIIELEAKIEEATVWAERAIEDVVDRDQRLRECQAELAAVKKERDQQLSEIRARLQAVYQSKTWRVMTRYWKLRDRLRV